MQVTLFRALRSISIDDEIAQKAVEAVEEHIEMAIGQAVKPLENKIDTLIAQIATLSTKIDMVGTGTQTAISNMRGEMQAVSGEMKSVKWVSVGTTGFIALFGAAAGFVAKLIL